MSATEEERKKQKISKSLFSESDAAQTLARIRQASASERQKRQKNFLKYILPPFVLLICVAGYAMRKPIATIFRPAPPFVMPEEHSNELTNAESTEKNQKHFGNPDAAMKIYLRFMDEHYAPEGIMELAHDAVESKPSEIYLTVEFRPCEPLEEEYQILINEQSRINVTKNDESQVINFKKEVIEEDFILALESVHAQVYGQVEKPLKLSLSENVLEKRRLHEESAPPVIIPEKKAAEVKAGGKAILLPDFKADTTVISP